MKEATYISDEARKLLAEIIEHETEPDYWRKRFEKMQYKEEIIVRGCFGELKNNNLISVLWADDIPYHIQVLKDGYTYEERIYRAELDKLKTEAHFSPFERELFELLHRTKMINSPINAAPIGTDMNEYNRPSNIWINDFEIFYHRYLTDHPLAKRIESILFHRKLSTYNDLVSVLESICGDTEYRKRKHINQENLASDNIGMQLSKYDVFISHASKDKVELVDKLYQSLNMLDIKIFYDKESLEWGDNWKERILEGTEKSEFAIIVISENFFGREWTERELTEFLGRQNKNGQKVILPILHNITRTDLQNHYPSIVDIQGIKSNDYTCDQIAILFARQLIKRLRDQ